jgi:hypothetical protein
LKKATHRRRRIRRKGGKDGKKRKRKKNAHETLDQSKPAGHGGSDRDERVAFTGHPTQLQQQLPPATGKKLLLYFFFIKYKINKNIQFTNLKKKID